MNEYLTINTNSIAIIISIISIIISIIALLKNLKWQKNDIIIRQQSEKRQREDERKKKLAPYIDIVNSTCFEFNELFSEYSTRANQLYSKITHLADSYNNNTNTMSLRHHMCKACDGILKEISEDILLKHPEYIFSKLNKYRKLDYIIDLKNKQELCQIKYNLKVVNENINSKEKKMYLNKVIEEIFIIKDIFINNQEKIDFTIKRLKKEIFKYENYDFDTIENNFYLEFKGLLHLFLYIKKISTDYTCEFEEDFQNLTLSEILYKLSSIMVANELILRISRY